MKESWSRVLVCLMMCASRGAAYSRVMSLGGKSRSPAQAVYRPGASVLRPSWAAPPQRFVQAASNRAPYVYYKNPASHSRYVKPQYSNKFAGYVAGPWRAAVRLPTSSPAYEFVRVSPSEAGPLRVDGDRGPIYTMPAPNLSLADKPIVVMDAHLEHSTASSELLNKTKMYEVTEKTIDPLNFGISSRFVASASGPQPFTFSKAPSLASPELLELMRNSAQQFQLADTYPLPILHQPQLLRHTALGPQYTLQGFNAIMQPSIGTDPGLLQQNILFKPDPTYIQKISNQLYQRYPGAEFYQYPMEAETTLPAHVYIVAEDDRKHGTEVEHINAVRAVDEGTIVALVPQTTPSAAIVTNETTISVQNITETPTTESVTVPVLNVTDSEVTIAKVEATTAAAKDTPIYYPQIGQNIGSIIANGFYSALTDVRAAEALASIETTEQRAPLENKTEISPMASEFKLSVVQNTNKEDNKTADIVRPLQGSPFTKAEPLNNIAYSFLRREGDTKSDVAKEGVRIAGQIVEASISDDDDFNHEKAALRRRPLLRLFSNYETTTEKHKKIEIKPKAKPPKSKLTFDDKGEPVIRIYASYESSNSKSTEEIESVTKKYSRNEATRSSLNVKNTPQAFVGWKTSSTKYLDHSPSGSDTNQVTQFGLKLRPRMDDYTSIFEYEE